MIRENIWEEVREILFGTIYFMVGSALFIASLIIAMVVVMEHSGLWVGAFFFIGEFIILSYYLGYIEDFVDYTWYLSKGKAIAYSLSLLCALALPFGLLHIIVLDPNRYEEWVILLSILIGFFSATGFLVLLLFRIGRLAKWACKKMRRHPTPSSSVMTI